MALDIKVHGEHKLRAVARALRHADRVDLVRGLNKAIREGGKETLDDLKSTVRALPITGFPFPRRKRAFSSARWNPAHNLREDVAAGVTLKVQVSEDSPSVRFRASGRRVPGTHGDSMPRRLDNLGGWRHPVLGNREVWVKQQGKPWFANTIYKDRDEFARRIEVALEETRVKIEGAA